MVSNIMSTLVIVESPAKCKKIEDFLGNNYKCLASFGHIQQLSSLKNIDFHNNYNLTFEIIKEKSPKIKLLKDAVKKSKEVIIATDDDREGEAIGWHLCNVLNFDILTTKRIIFHEITKKAILKSMSNPTIINMNIVQAQNARQILDLYIGFKLSPILWEQISRKYKDGLSAGRCQTPALKIIYENQLDIKNAKKEIVYNTVGYFTSKNIPFELNFQFSGQTIMEEFLEESVNFDHSITCSKPSKVIKKPPEPFITSTLQQAASNNFHWGPKETMKCAQTLYENGYITYMRTDCKKYSEEFLDKTNKYIVQTYEEKYVHEDLYSLSNSKNTTNDTNNTTKKNKTNKTNDDKVDAQEAHEAIRPTNIEINTISKDNITSKEKNLYKLIRNHTLKSCMANAILSKINATISAPMNKKYSYNSHITLFKGWKIVDDADENDPYYSYLPNINDTIVNYNKLKCKTSIKNQKQHLTEAKLISVLEEKGIGRPSTYSSIVEKNKERKYFEKNDITGTKLDCIDLELEDDTISEFKEERTFGNENKKLIIKPLGNMVIDVLIKYFEPIFDYEYTKLMENNLDLISKGELPYHNMLDDCISFINDLLNKYSKINPSKNEYALDKKHVFMIGKYGPVIKHTDEHNNITWKNVRKDVSIEDIKTNKYSIDEILEQNGPTKLGTYKEIDVLLKHGKYGHYVEYNNKNINIKNLSIEPSKINLSHVIDLLDSSSNNQSTYLPNNNSSILRKINDEISIRNGKFGNYIYYKTTAMTKPQFVKLSKFNEDYLTCDIKSIKDFVKKSQYNKK